MGSQSHLFLLHSSSKSTVLTRLAAYNLCNPIKRYSKRSDDGGEDFLHLAKTKNEPGTKQRAPSLAEEFDRVAQQKSKAEKETKGAEQGVASQTIEKVYDGAEEATIGGSKVESAKDRYEQHEEGADYHRKPPTDAGVLETGP